MIINPRYQHPRYRHLDIPGIVMVEFKGVCPRCRWTNIMILSERALERDIKCPECGTTHTILKTNVVVTDGK